MFIVYEFEGNSPLMYVERGHVPIDDFCNALLVEYRKNCKSENIEHAYYRYVPVVNSDEMIMIKAKGAGRGAFAVTCVNFDLCETVISKNADH